MRGRRFVVSSQRVSIYAFGLAESSNMSETGHADPRGASRKINPIPPDIMPARAGRITKAITGGRGAGGLLGSFEEWK